MPKYIVVELSESQEAELEKTRHQHPKAYMRERAAAVLKVAKGETVSVVAEKGLLTRHEPETVHQWIKKYLAQGLKGWDIRNGRGRKAAFSPSKSTSGS